MKYKVHIYLISVILIIFTASSCNKDDDGPSFNLFSVEDDIQLGAELNQEIKTNEQQYSLMDPALYPDAYSHLRRIRDSVINTGLVDYDEKFVWEVYLMDNDTTLNAFATPGGYMYFYTGLIKFLDNEAEFAGVMGHEMAHAAERHSTNQLTKVYGIQILLSVALGQDPSQLAEIAAGLASGLATLAFSRNHEYEADEYAVRYLNPTSYDARGVAGFFEKLEGTQPVPEFLSTHPSPENRVEEINALWEELGAIEGNWYMESYNDFKATLP